MVEGWGDRFPTTFTPQGDGNHSDRLSGSRKYLPPISDYLYPARGRKRQRPSVLHRVQIHFRLPLPRKGTETTAKRERGIKTARFPTTFTPQGDGNASTQYKVTASRINISDYLYPARGRKRNYIFFNPIACLRDFRLPLPRKGTETA